MLSYSSSGGGSGNGGGNGGRNNNGGCNNGHNNNNHRGRKQGQANGSRKGCTFDTSHEAAIAYDAAARRLYGDEARLNLPHVTRMPIHHHRHHRYRDLFYGGASTSTSTASPTGSSSSSSSPTDPFGGDHNTKPFHFHQNENPNTGHAPLLHGLFPGGATSAPSFPPPPQQINFPIVDLYLAPPPASAPQQQHQQPDVFPYLDINVAPPAAEEEMMMDIDSVVVAPPEEVIKTEPVSEEPAAGQMNRGTLSFDWADLNAELPAVDDSSLWEQARAGTSFQRMNDPGVFDDEENYPW
ncbi:OLC1v1018096C1 [Oldenlandia corymbosa var. corymbosa]|uniref:OLC1v1018096C1 n=1 Tax=Oldenlandia corymbosa var. corymbosa TaxID=529605 RepID=A0AAV1EAV2_OLDCO|nr:OLC1v1018096C1 [Oldenlandia corymbosa var. corymbosa]